MDAILAQLGDSDETLRQEYEDQISPAERQLSAKPIVIEDNVWLADGVIVTGGSIIGKGSVIGANAVVKGNIPAYCIAVGAPARPIKMFNHATKLWETLK